MQLPEPGKLMYLVLPVQGLTLFALWRISSMIAKGARLIDQHRMMWYEYARAHNIPIDDDMHTPGNGKALARGATG